MWVKPKLGLFFFLENVVFSLFFVLFFVVVHVSKKITKWIGGGGWGLANPSFSRIFFFFQLDKTSNRDNSFF